MNCFTKYGNPYLVVTVRGGDNVGGLDSAAVGLAGVASSLRIGVDTVLGWVVAALVRAVRGVEGIEEVALDAVCERQ